MSRESVELVQAAYDAYFSGDMERLLSLVAPDVVVEQPRDQADFRVYEGHEGLMQAVTEWTGEWDDYRVEILRVADADPHVLVTVRQHGRGKASGVEVESVFTFVHTVESGRVTSWRMFTSEAEARDAAGLRE